MEFILKKIGVLLGLGFIIGGLVLVWEMITTLGNVFNYGIITVFSILPKLPTNIFDVLENIIADNWSLTKIQWIDITLLNIASFTPSIIAFLISKLGLKINGTVSGLLSFTVFY